MAHYRIIPISDGNERKGEKSNREKNFGRKDLVTSCYHPFAMKNMGKRMSIFGSRRDPLGPIEYNGGKLFGLIRYNQQKAVYDEIGNYHQYVSTECAQKTFGHQDEDGLYETNPYLFTLYFNKR